MIETIKNIEEKYGEKIAVWAIITMIIYLVIAR
jgi:hypothetical protein